MASSTNIDAVVSTGFKEKKITWQNHWIEKFRNILSLLKEMCSFLFSPFSLQLAVDELKYQTLQLLDSNLEFVKHSCHEYVLVGYISDY